MIRIYSMRRPHVRTSLRDTPIICLHAIAVHVQQFCLVADVTLSIAIDQEDSDVTVDSEEETARKNTVTHLISWLTPLHNRCLCATVPSSG